MDETSPYALTGAVFASDRTAVRQAAAALRGAAGNFYVNDKPTGAVVGQQPFGGARGSGTNDKAGSKLNLVRWVSARTVKETFSPPRDFRYPFMTEESAPPPGERPQHARPGLLRPAGVPRGARSRAPASPRTAPGDRLTDRPSLRVRANASRRCGGARDHDGDGQLQAQLKETTAAGP